MLITLGINIIFPAILLTILWRARFKNKFEWLLDALLITAIISWLFLSANWGWIGLYVRYVWLILLIIALIISWKKMLPIPWLVKYSGIQWFSIFIYVAMLFLFILYNAFVIKSYSVKEESLDLQFPLQNGTYYVGQGGNHVMMNYHHRHPSQQYALDILKLNAFGMRASGLYPKQLQRYEIFGDVLVSPCNGTIVEQADGLPDLIPPNSDPENVSGNYVDILCDGTDVIVHIAHMMNGSVIVQTGEQVESGQPIGKVGNSGNTSEPHLHIHAERDGYGVPITFQGRFLVRNSIIRQQ